MKSYVKILFKLISGVIGIALLLGVVFVLVTINQIPEERIRKYDHLENKDESVITFEQGSIIKKEDLGFFYKFTGEKSSLKNWLDKNKESLELVKGGDYVLTKDLSLKNLAKNHCESLYCFQKRMSFENIPGVFWKGLIGIEDYRFLEHHGVDPRSIARAILADLKAMKMVQGGSTLTQQLVKNLFYSNEKKISRKIKEMIVALYIESKFSKENILESYFNEVFWGSLNGLNIKGVYAASAFYFSKTPQEIKPFEAAILIGLLKGPNYYNPLRHLDRLKKRANIVFNKLQELRLFSSTGIKNWSDKDWQVWVKKLKNQHTGFQKRAMWRTSVSDKNSPFNAYEIYALNLEIEKLKSVLKTKAKNKDIGIKFLMTDVENNKKYSYYSKYERNKARAINEEFHQVGSTLKPIAYNIFAKYDYKLEDSVSTLPIELKLKSGKWGPREAHKIAEEEVTLKDALLLSYNRPVIRLSNDIGFEKIETEFLTYVPKIKTPLAEYPSQLLGAVELSINELWTAYFKFINNECSAVKHGDKSWEQTILYQMSNPEETTVRRLVGKKMGQQRFFGKTGTSNNGLDNWYVFFDGKYLGVIWVGLEGSREGESLGLYGGTTSFRLYKGFMRNRGKRFNELSCDFFSKKSVL